MHWSGGHWLMGGMWLGWLLVIVVLAALIWLIARAATDTGRRGGGLQDGGRTPKQVLKERYARGEIDRAEYEQRLADLRR